MSEPRHATVVCTEAGLPYIMGTVEAMRFLGTLECDAMGRPLNLPAEIISPLPADGGIGNPVTSGNTPPLYRWGGWAGMAIPDSSEGANDGTLALLMTLAAAHPDDIKVYVSGPEGGVADSSASGWIDVEHEL